MAIDLGGHVSLITGGNGGIGLAMAMAVAGAGADVAIWGTNAAKNKAAEEQLRSTGRRVVASICDVRDEDQVAHSFATAVKELGKVDSVFANAGIGPARGAPFTEMTLDEWRTIMAVNAEGTFLTLREGARHLVDRGEGGSLVAVSSVSSIHGAPRNEHYAASKTAVLALIRGLAVELARDRIRCNALVPGWVETDLTEKARRHEKFMSNTLSRMPLRRWGVPEDLGPAAVYLADPANLAHTGDTLIIDGAYSIF